jgi:hypothetical protein
VADLLEIRETVADLLEIRETVADLLEIRETVVDLARNSTDGGRSATLAPAWRVGGSTIVLRWTETVADLPTSGRCGLTCRHLAVAG